MKAIMTVETKTDVYEIDATSTVAYDLRNPTRRHHHLCMASEGRIVAGSITILEKIKSAYEIERFDQNDVINVKLNIDNGKEFSGKPSFAGGIPDLTRGIIDTYGKWVRGL